MIRRSASPPRPISPGDIVVACSDELGEWTAAQITDLDPSWGSAGVLDLDWSGPEPDSFEALGDLAPLRLTYGAVTGQLSHGNYQWLLPRGCSVIGNAPPLVDRRSNSYSSAWRLGDELARQRRWERGERVSTHPGEKSFYGTEIPHLVAATRSMPEVWDVSITQIETLSCGDLATLFPNVTRLFLAGDLGTLTDAAALNRLRSLRSLSVSNLFGMLESDCLSPTSVPNLAMLALHSIPAEYAGAMRRTWAPEIDRGTYVDITAPRKADWVAENRDNPLREWDGRDHISAARFRKSVAQYRATRRAVLEALRVTAGDVGVDVMTMLGRQYGEAFNGLDGRRNPFIESEECEDLFRALHAIVDHAQATSEQDLSTARDALIAGVESVRTW